MLACRFFLRSHKKNASKCHLLCTTPLCSNANNTKNHPQTLRNNTTTLKIILKHQTTQEKNPKQQNTKQPPKTSKTTKQHPQSLQTHLSLPRLSSASKWLIPGAAVDFEAFHPACSPDEWRASCFASWRGLFMVFIGGVWCVFFFFFFFWGGG